MVHYPSAPPQDTRPRRLRRPARRSRARTLVLLGCLPLTLCLVLCAIAYMIVPPASVDILILGVDAQPGQRYLTRTDAIMLLNVSPGTLGVALLSIPRDVAIAVPGYGEQRINTINVLGEQESEGGGPALLKASFKESFDVTVENYVRLDFQGFVAVVDAVGGVDIDVPKLIIDYEYPTPDGGIMTVQFDPGKQHMDGERALQYARTRHQDDDYQRAGRQQQVVDAVVKKLANPLHWPRVVQAVRDHTDTDLSTWNMLRTGPALLVGWWSREQRVLQREDLVGSSAGARPDYDSLQPWIDAYFD